MLERYLIALVLTCILSSQSLIALAEAPVATKDPIPFNFTSSNLTRFSIGLRF